MPVHQGEREAFLGKRTIVSIRQICRDAEDVYSAFWGLIVQVDKEGVLLRIEGGLEQEFWMMPPDLTALNPADKKFYTFEGHEGVVEDVDFVACYDGSDDQGLLES
jgi:hypothetical protein